MTYLWLDFAYWSRTSSSCFFIKYNACNKIRTGSMCVHLSISPWQAKVGKWSTRATLPLKNGRCDGLFQKGNSLVKTEYTCLFWRDLPLTISLWTRENDCYNISLLISLAVMVLMQLTACTACEACERSLFLNFFIFIFTTTLSLFTFVWCIWLYFTLWSLLPLYFGGWPLRLNFRGICTHRNSISCSPRLLVLGINYDKMMLRRAPKREQESLSSPPIKRAKIEV